MPCATAYTVTLAGARGHLVEVQADVTPGLVSTRFIGRPDPSVSEAADRCRSALVNCGLGWPTTRRLTVLLSPADLPKKGSHVDLAIALAVLAAQADRVPPALMHALASTVLLGELTLDGLLRPVPAVLPMVLAARARGLTRVLVPEVHAAELALVPDLEVLGVRSLPQALAVLAGHDSVPEAPPVPELRDAHLLTWRGRRRTEDLDLADVHGMADARYALEVVAAGGHHLMLSGPKGAGKTTLAERLPGLLPDLSIEQALELAAVHSLAGEPAAGRVADRRPPFRAPHHAATKASVLGGGSGRVHPGEISRALHGVLFLDEFPLFALDIIEALRQPLESGEVTIARGVEVATFPARSLVVLASNPCPCGDFHPDARQSRCACGEVRRRAYRDRMSGPVLDRLDVVRHLSPVRPHEAVDRLSRPEPTAAVRARVEAARSLAGRRYEGTGWRVNADVPGPDLARRWPLDAAGQQLLDEALSRGRLSRRGATRVHRLAWTVADLDGVDRPGRDQTVVALALRLGEPLPLAALTGRAS